MKEPKLQLPPTPIKLHDVFKLSESQLFFRIQSLLVYLGYRVSRGTDYVYGSPPKGGSPVILVAHVDTVHRSLPTEVFHDQKKGILWAPGGLGADDRAGVWLILEVLRRGGRPYILLTDGEEVGGRGAQEAVRAITPAKRIRLLVELDRRNGTEAVFYSQDVPEIEEYILQLGYKKSFGSFTDISFLCPGWRIPGVNLSVGYYGAHTSNEYLNLQELYQSLERVERILVNPPPKVEYRERQYTAYSTYEAYFGSEDDRAAYDWSGWRKPLGLAHRSEVSYDTPHYYWEAGAFVENYGDLILQWSEGHNGRMPDVIEVKAHGFWWEGYLFDSDADAAEWGLYGFYAEPGTLAEGSEEVITLRFSEVHSHEVVAAQLPKTGWLETEEAEEETSGNTDMK